MSHDYLNLLNQGYVAPNNEHLISFRNNVGLTTTDMAALVGEKSKKFRKFMNEKHYLNGSVIEYCQWRILIEKFGLVEPFKLEQRIPKIRPEVFDSKNFKCPTFTEFSYLAKRSGYAAETIGKEINIPVQVVQSAMNNPSDKVVNVDKDEWFAFLDSNGLSSMEKLKELPELDFKSLLQSDEFMPPRPNQLRRFVAWTGYTPNEIEELLDIPASKLTYLMSNRAGRSSEVKLSDNIFSRFNWVAPYSHELRDILKVTRTDPGAVARLLKMSRGEVVTILKAPNSYRLNVEQGTWFNFLEKNGIVNSNAIKSRLSNETKVHSISFARWIYLLSVFGVVNLINAE